MKAHYAAHERVEIRTAKVEHRCWSHTEDCKAPGDGYDDKPTCTHLIAPGDQYVVSTIYSGHDSGYADNRVKWNGSGWDRVPSSPISSPFCMPCAERWVNTARALKVIRGAA